MRTLGFIAIVLAAGCSSALREEAVPSERVLAGPYALRLTVTPQIARPGEHVLVSVEFENTGTAALWTPRGREVFLGYRYASGSGETSASSCDGIRHVRLRPKEKVRYEQSFEVPNIEGIIQIYPSVRRDVSVPLTIERWIRPELPAKKEANKAPEPTPRPVMIPAEPGITPGRVVAHL